MRQIEPSTFILNRNDVEYYFVEGKSSSKTGPVYYFYHNIGEKPLKFNADSFVETFGMDEKIAVVKFVKQALLDLTVLYGTDSNIDFIYDKLYMVYSRIEGNNDIKKPSLGKYRNHLIEAIIAYNKIKDMLPKEPEIPYSENYELIKEEYIYEQTYTENKNINSKQMENNELAFGGVQRRLKYDN